MSMDAKKILGTDDDVPMPDIYAEELTIDEPLNEDIEPESAMSDKESGFDPYDTARLYKKQG